MKKGQASLRFFVCVALCTFFCTLPSATHAYFARTLTIGSSGTDVSELQRLLQDAGFYTYPTITGYFGPVTAAAVAAYQSAHALSSVGVVGPQTRATLNGDSVVTTPSTSTNAPLITRTLDLGTVGLDVSALQAFLEAQGFYQYPTITGYFGPVTAAAVAAFQAAHGLPPVGIVGPQTRAMLSVVTGFQGNNSVGGFGSTHSTTQTSGHSVNVTPTSPTPETPAPADNTPPVLSSIASSTTSTTATITWSTNENASSTVNYGTTGSYGTASTSTALVASHSITLTGLTPSTTYHFQVASGDASNNFTTSGDNTFTTTATPDTTAPVISSIATSTTPSSATISWATDENASSTIAYGTTTAYGSASSSPTLATSHSITLSGLTSATTYHYQIQSADSSNNLATTTDATFTTASGAIADGTVTAASIESSGYIADVTVKGLSAGGSYALTPDVGPKLAFNVTSAGYDSTGAATTVSRVVYGTIPTRLAYPNGASTTESVSGGNLTTQVVLSDDILPNDTVSLSGLSGWYTQGTTTASVSNLATTNNSTTSEYRPIGAWVTPTNLRRASTTPFTVEFSVVSKFPRNNGQVAAVIFTATDGSASVSHTVSSMSQSTYLTHTTCTATSGSAVLTSCGSTDGMIPGQFVTVSTGSASGVNIGEPKISSVDSTTQLTLNTTAVANGTVTVTLGNPVYVYAATFTNSELNTLAQGTTTVKAVAYTNVGTITLDTSQGADGVTPIAAGTVTPNLKNLQFLNDKNDKYVPVYAWVSGSAGASPAVQTTATDPGSTAYYGSIKSAADALKTYYNTNYGHNNACGGVIYLKVGTTTGFGGDLGTSGDSPTNCATYLTISAEPGHGPTDTDIDASSSANRGAGYTTIIKNLKLTDNATNKIVIAGPDGSTATPRVAHNIFQNDWLLETQSSPSAFLNQVGWREFYNSLVDESVGDSAMLQVFSTTGVTSNEFGSSLFGNNGQADAYTILGNVFSSFRILNAGVTSANAIQPTSMLFAFNKVMNNTGNTISMNTDSVTKNNFGFAQNAFEQVGTAQTQAAFLFAGDDDVTPFRNVLRIANTIVGNRTNQYYNSLGGGVVTKLGHDLFNLDYLRNSKSDYFYNPLDRYITGVTVTAGGSGYTNATVTIGSPTGTNGITALAHANLSGGAVSTITLDTTVCGNTGGVGYSSVPSVTITGDGTGATATAVFSGSGVTQPCGVRNGNWRYRFGVGNIGNVNQGDSNSNTAPGYSTWVGDYMGLPGNTTVNGTGQTSFTFKAANQNTSGGGNNTGFGWYKPSTTTGLTNRVPSGYAPFPGDIEGTPRKNDGTGCAGAYEC